MELLGLPVPAGLDGISLVKGAPSARAFYFEALDANLTRGWAPLTGVVRDRWKYIDLPVPELYDLSSDPHEIANQFDGNRQRADELSRVLQLTPSSAPGASTPIGIDAANRLRSLGYVGGGRSGPSAGSSHYSEGDDPKRLVALNERFNIGLEAFNEGRGDEALAAFTAVLRERPDFITARTSAATILLSANRPGEAVALLRDAPGDQASSPELLAKMGSALRDSGDLKGAADAFSRALQAGDQNPVLLNDLGVVFARMGRGDDARRMFNELLKIDPHAAGTWYNLGMFELVDHHPERAVDALRHAVDADAGYADAWRELGVALIERDRPAAIDAWKRAERLKPTDYDLLFNLGMVLAASHRDAEALPYLERFEREAPSSKYTEDLPRVRALLTQLKGRSQGGAGR
jgi:Flp pilus assembly protein TadD